MEPPKDKLTPLEQSILNAAKALDNQILRATQRDASQRAIHGTQKWEPYQTRIENLCSFLMNSLGEQEISLDGLIVLAQAFSKTLCLVTADLGADGLGEVRSDYIKATFENLEKDAHSVKRSLNSENSYSN